MLHESMSEQERDEFFIANKNKDEWFRDHTDRFNPWRTIPYTKIINRDTNGVETIGIVYHTERLTKGIDGIWRKFYQA